MRIITTLVLSILSVTLMAQVPQGVGYQGVATDASGIELVNQAISIRASVLSGSANGTIEWEETHATTTDTFGLFTLTIGQGTNTTNGVQASFADISWGTNTHFLKIEMDVTGGSTYSNMGTNQMMSVPYALYAESANLDYDSIANYLSGDSTFVTNISSGLGGGGCNYQFPEGLDGESITSTCTYSNPYIVPTNKRLIVLLTDNNPEINGVQLPDINGGEVLILNSGDALSPWDGIGDLDFHGILIEPTTSVTSITLTCTYSNPYIVPTNKRLIVLLTDNNSEINGVQLTDINNSEVLILNSGDTFSPWNGIGDLDFNGYLADENYFENCGGSSDGGNSNSSSGGGCSFQYPDGLEGESVLWNFSNGNYTVPSGKNLYISAAYDWSYDVIEISTETVNYMGVIPNVSAFIFNDNHEIYDSNNAGNFNGILVDANVSPVLWNFSNGNYTVPSGKNLYISAAYDWSYDVIEISTETVNYMGVIPNGSAFIFNDNHEIYDSNNAGNFNGYLADEDYFADCGGGGSSNSSAQFNNQISNYNNILDESITSGILNYLHASHPTNSSFNYTVPAGKIMKITDANLTSGGGNNPTYINGQLWKLSANLPTLISEGTQIEIQFDGYNGDGVAIQYDLIDNTQGIILNYLYASHPNNSSFNYTVPAGKIMKITDANLTSGGGNNPTYINGQLWKLSANLPTLISEGTQIEIQFDGYTGDGVAIQYILFDN